VEGDLGFPCCFRWPARLMGCQLGKEATMTGCPLLLGNLFLLVSTRKAEVAEASSDRVRKVSANVRFSEVLKVDVSFS